MVNSRAGCLVSRRHRNYFSENKKVRHFISVTTLTFHVGWEGVYDELHGCLQQRHWVACDKPKLENQCGKSTHLTKWAQSSLSPQRSKASLKAPLPWQ